MANYVEELEDLIDEVWDLDLTDPDRKKGLYKALKTAQLHKDIDYEFDIRISLVVMLCQIDEHLEAYSLFPWVLSTFDKDPDNFDELDLLDTYRWVCEGISEYPTFLKQDFEQLLDDFKKRLLKADCSLRSVVLVQHSNALCFGDEEGYKHSFEALKDLKTYPKDEISESDEGWNIQYTLEHILEYEKNLEKALALAKKTLKKDAFDGEHYVFKLRLLMGFLEQNRMDLIPEVHTKMLFDKNNTEHSYNPQYEVAFYGLTLNFDLACETIEKYLNVITPSPSKYFYFYLGVDLFLECLKQNNIETIALKLPAKIGFQYQDATAIPVNELKEFITNELDGFENAFYQRNGNTYFTKERQLYQEKIKYSLKTPLKL